MHLCVYESGHVCLGSGHVFVFLGSESCILCV